MCHVYFFITVLYFISEAIRKAKKKEVGFKKKMEEEQVPFENNKSNTSNTKKPKSRAYTCTPKQLEALKKAREAKRLRTAHLKQQQHRVKELKEEEEGEQEEVEDVFNAVNANSNEPVQVVRSDKFLKQFLESEKIDAQETGLGKRKRDESNQGLKKLQELRDELPMSYHENTTNKILLGIGIGAGVGCGLGLAYWASSSLNNKRASSPHRKAKAFARPSTESPPGPSKPATPPPSVHIMKAPWER